MAVNKVVKGSDVLIDLTGDTVEAASLLRGVTAHDRSGTVITGNCDYDSDTSDATAAASEILATKSAYVAGSKVIGSMVNRAGMSEVINDKDDVISIPVGFHDGSGSVQLDSTEKAKLIEGNIKEGVTILGVTGNVSPASGVTAQSKTATPSFSQQVITPDSSPVAYDYLSQVTVNAIPYVETPNAAGGVTVTIG